MLARLSGLLLALLLMVGVAVPMEARAQTGMSFSAQLSQLRTSTFGDFGYSESPGLFWRGRSPVSGPLYFVGHAGVDFLQSDPFRNETAGNVRAGFQYALPLSGWGAFEITGTSGAYIGPPNNRTPKMLIAGDVGLSFGMGIVVTAELGWLPYRDGLFKPSVTLGYRL